MLFAGATDLLLNRMIEELVPALNKHELRYLLRKMKLTDEQISELEQRFAGKDKLQERVRNSLHTWRQLRGKDATTDEIIRIVHIIGWAPLASKLRSMKVLSQAIKL